MKAAVLSFYESQFKIILIQTVSILETLPVYEDNRLQPVAQKVGRGNSVWFSLMQSAVQLIMLQMVQLVLLWPDKVPDCIVLLYMLGCSVRNLHAVCNSTHR
jgi:hypothetical protein